MKKTGFTLIELLVAIAILLILVFIGIPSYKELIANNNMVSSSNGIVEAFNYARMEAVKRGNTVGVGDRADSSWTGEIVVWVDSDADGSIDETETELRLWQPLSSATSVVSTNSSFVFKASGEVNNADILKLCDDRSGEQGRKIEILTSGAIYAEENVCD